MITPEESRTNGTLPEPYMRFIPDLAISFQTSGIQSAINFGKIDEERVVRKTSGIGLPREDLHTLGSHIEPYRSSLTHAGLRLPPNVSIRIDQGIEIIDLVVPGQNIEEMIQGNDPLLESAWKTMIHQICLARENGSTLSQAMIDVKPANFILSPEGELYYIDLFPPMMRGADGMVTPWLPEVFQRDRRLMSFNFGDIRGQLTKLLAGSRLAYKDAFPQLATWTMQIITPLLPATIIDYIQGQLADDFPDMQQFYGGAEIGPRINLLNSQIAA